MSPGAHDQLLGQQRQFLNVPAAGRLHSRQGHISALAAGVGVSEWTREAQRDPERGAPGRAAGSEPGAACSAQGISTSHRQRTQQAEWTPWSGWGSRSLCGACGQSDQTAAGPEPELLGG